MLRFSPYFDFQDYQTLVKFNANKMNLHLPTATFRGEVGDFKVSELFKKFGAQILVIYQGLLLEKRILFVGYDSPASDLCQYVLATCLLVCPPLTNVITRAFPYTNLSYMDFRDM